MFCRNCGSEFNGSFCPNCGAPKWDPQDSSQTSNFQTAAQQPAKQNRPITSKWWFWVMLVLTVAVVASVLSQTKDAKEQSLTSGPEPTQRTALEEQSEPTNKPASLSSGVVTDQTQEQSTGQSKDIALPAETILIDRDGIRVTATGLTLDGWYGPEINVLIENNTESSITVQVRSASVNGAMVNPIMSCDVAAGKKANETISISQTELDTAGIKNIQFIELVTIVMDSESYETQITSDPVVLVTSATKEMQLFDDGGFTALEQDGLKVVIQGIQEEDSYFGKGVRVFLENNTGSNITIQLQNVSVNGFMVDPLFYCDVLDGKVAYSSINFMKEDLEKNGIDEINTLEFSILAYNATTWDTVFESDIVTINFPF